jgi:hypothetical protein
MIQLHCPHCDKKLGVDDALEGRLAVCPRCKKKFRVSRSEGPAADESSDDRYAVRPRNEPQLPRKKTRRPVEDSDEDYDEVVKPRRRRADDDEDDEPVRPKRRRVDDEEDEPVRPKRRRVDDEDDWEDEDEPPRRSRKRKSRGRSGGFGGMDPFVAGLLGLGVVSVLLVVLAFIWPALSLVPIVLGWLVAIGGGIWFLVVAFQDSPAAGLLCLFVPFYSLIYLCTHFDETKKPFFVQLLGGGILMGGFLAAGLAAKKDNRLVHLGQPVVWVVPSRGA